MRWLIAVLLISITAAHAQTPVTGAAGTPASPPPAAAEQTAPATKATAAHHGRRTLQARFDEANTTHDGHLTLEQARSKMPSVARDFDAIDTDHKGYVTIDQIKAHSRAARAAKRAAKQEQH